MPATPPQFDLWLVAHLSTLWDRSPTLDFVFEQGVSYGVFGGLLYAGAFFVLWIQGTLPGQRYVRRRILTISLASLITASMLLMLTYAVSWPPPSAHPDLATNYLESFTVNLNATSFPSQSAAVYATLAAGIYSLHKTFGICAWIGVAMLVALPRIYLGAHYFTDVFAGVVAGTSGYLIAIPLERKVAAPFETKFEFPLDKWQRILLEGIVFLWLLQVATGFRLVLWIISAVARLWT